MNKLFMLCLMLSAVGISAGQNITNTVKHANDDYSLDFSTVPNGRFNARDFGLQWEFGGGARNANNTNFLYVTNGELARLPIGTPGIGPGWSNNPNADYLWRSNPGPIAYAQVRYRWATNGFSGTQFNPSSTCYSEALNISVKANSLGLGNGSININDGQWWFHLNLFSCGAQLALFTNNFNVFAGDSAGWRRHDGFLDTGNLLYWPQGDEEWLSGFEVSGDYTTIRVHHGSNSWTYSTPAITNIFWPGKTNSVWVELVASTSDPLTNRFYTPMIKSWRFGKLSHDRTNLFAPVVSNAPSVDGQVLKSTGNF
jgi:hypothetical protein